MPAKRSRPYASPDSEASASPSDGRHVQARQAIPVASTSHPDDQDDPFSASSASSANALIPFKRPEIGLSLEEIRLQHAIAIVSKEEREAPWYTPWLMALDLSMKKLHATDDHTVPLTMPQYPVRRGDDTYVIPEAPYPALLPQAVQASPTPAGKAKASTVRNVEGDTQDRQAGAAATASVAGGITGTGADSVGEGPAESSATIKYVLQSPRKPFDRTTRIPDFVEVMYWKLIINGAEFWSRGCIVLIIEVKPTPQIVPGTARILPTTIYSLAKATDQTTEQAQHVFEGDADRRPDMLGIITCCGPFWYYREATERSLPRFPSLEERKDGTFPSPVGTLSDGESIFSRTPAVAENLLQIPSPPRFLQPYATNGAYFELGTTESKAALDAIAERVRVNNPRIFGPTEHETSES
ncbi:hypothetical protein NM688_g5877 [Phlebia brevispora]|uniref:Uncharacterized protein n=1 Tax=Phlebia brevispora TaxID=194682 RepID=A0ACC1SNQ5_9APHY|nr:hypothetical protein NM688_g5877 [Phlebia brevispora]